MDIGCGHVPHKRTLFLDLRAGLLLAKRSHAVQSFWRSNPLLRGLVLRGVEELRRGRAQVQALGRVLEAGGGVIPWAVVHLPQRGLRLPLWRCYVLPVRRCDAPRLWRRVVLGRGHEVRRLQEIAQRRPAELRPRRGECVGGPQPHRGPAVLPERAHQLAFRGPIVLAPWGYIVHPLRGAQVSCDRGVWVHWGLVESRRAQQLSNGR